MQYIQSEEIIASEWCGNQSLYAMYGTSKIPNSTLFDFSSKIRKKLNNSVDSSIVEVKVYWT